MTWFKFIFFLVVSIFTGTFQSVVFGIDVKSVHGVGTTVGFWLFSAGLPIVLTLIILGTFYLFKRKIMPKSYGVLWGLWIFFTGLSFFGFYINTLNH